MLISGSIAWLLEFEGIADQVLEKLGDLDTVGVNAREGICPDDCIFIPYRCLEVEQCLFKGLVHVDEFKP